MPKKSYLRYVDRLYNKCLTSTCCHKHCAIIIDESKGEPITPFKCNVRGDGDYHAEAMVLKCLQQYSKVAEEQEFDCDGY